MVVHKQETRPVLETTAKERERCQEQERRRRLVWNNGAASYVADQQVSVSEYHINRKYKRETERKREEPVGLAISCWSRASAGSCAIIAVSFFFFLSFFFFFPSSHFHADGNLLARNFCFLVDGPALSTAGHRVCACVSDEWERARWSLAKRKENEENFAWNLFLSSDRVFCLSLFFFLFEITERNKKKKKKERRQFHN